MLPFQSGPHETVRALSKFSLPCLLMLRSFQRRNPATKTLLETVLLLDRAMRRNVSVLEVIASTKLRDQQAMVVGGVEGHSRDKTTEWTATTTTLASNRKREHHAAGPCLVDANGRIHHEDVFGPPRGASAWGSPSSVFRGDPEHSPPAKKTPSPSTVEGRNAAFRSTPECSVHDASTSPPAELMSSLRARTSELPRLGMYRETNGETQNLFLGKETAISSSIDVPNRRENRSAPIQEYHIHPQTTNHHQGLGGVDGEQRHSEVNVDDVTLQTVEQRRASSASPPIVLPQWSQQHDLSRLVRATSYGFDHLHEDATSAAIRSSPLMNHIVKAPPPRFPVDEREASPPSVPLLLSKGSHRRGDR